MRIAIGEISALCAGCGAEQFEPMPMSGALIRDRRFQCVVCKSEFEYGELLLQIEEQAAVTANKTPAKRYN